MQQRRRQLLRAAGLVAIGAGTAGCNGITGSETTPATGEGTATTASGASDDGGPSVSAGTAVAAEWNAMRMRLDDAYALGVAGNGGAGAAVADRTFQRFEDAGGEYGAHEFLEATSEEYYGGFEGAVTDLRGALADGDVGAAEEAWASAGTNLRSAQLAVVDETATYAFDVLRFGAAANNVETLVAADDAAGAAAVAEEAVTWFEDAAAHDVLESADGEAYESLESALGDARSAAANGNLDGVRSATAAAYTAAATGAYAVAADERTAGAGELAALQAQGFDAAVLSSLGGPSTDFAHAAALTTYRARAHDAAWLAARGETDTAQAMAENVFAHFEGARAHDALEAADGEAYEGFESGLESLVSATGNGDASGTGDALATVDDSLVTGVEALAGGSAPLLEAAFFRARIQDARELYRLGRNTVAASVARSVFGTFEANELGFHEAFESTDAAAYESFEGALESLVSAFEDGDDGGVEESAATVMEELLGFETAFGSTAGVSAAEAAYMAARGFDAAAVAALGESGRAASVAQATFQHFEAGAGGFHEALEAADGGLYETFEEHLGGIRSAANGGDVASAARTFNGSAVDAAYAVVSAGGGGNSGAAAIVVADTFAAVENARVHEMVEAADAETYETFESKLDAYANTVESGSGVGSAAGTFASAAQRGQFAAVGALSNSPVSADVSSGGEEEEEVELSGGPNVVEGVPEDADHVVDMQAVAFEPKELTVSVGDTVAWAHRAGEPHNVVAREEQLPEGAEYWNSGGFDAESAAVEGWENGQGAVQSGQSYVHTFETTGEHPYYCVPHEMAGMVGTVVVEE